MNPLRERVLSALGANALSTLTGSGRGMSADVLTTWLQASRVAVEAELEALHSEGRVECHYDKRSRHHPYWKLVI